MMTNCPSPTIPTIAQLQEYRRSGRVPKVDVMKSSAELVPVHHPRTGELLGYGELDDDDPNAVLDDLIFGHDVLEIVAKSADADDDPLAGIFPLWLQPS